ncbi:MAG: ribosomal-processing cysteine protease Prp [Lachnospiraceae bacterium]|nr:ribosomal-processing cysteine protease Prp [Lachnospiraceae bacterium]
MTRITIYKTKAGEYRKFTCDGHAAYADYGQDIVCAAISVLVINTVNALDEITKEPVQVEADENAGRISCSFLKQPLRETSVALMDSLVLGLGRIEAQYGKKHCKLIFKEV